MDAEDLPKARKMAPYVGTTRIYDILTTKNTRGFVDLRERASNMCMEM